MKIKHRKESSGMDLQALKLAIDVGKSMMVAVEAGMNEEKKRVREQVRLLDNRYK